MRNVSLIILVLLAGCRMPKFQPLREGGADLEVPAVWTGGGGENQGEVTFGWLAELNDPELEALVAEAIEHNRDLLAAAARLRVVHEGTLIARAGRLPSVTASGSASQAKFRSENTAGDLQPFVTADSARLFLSASWEIDLWGRLADLHHAAIEDYQAQMADYRGARLSLAANTVSAWLNLITAVQQVELARETLASFEKNYRITERNYRAGDPTTSSLAVNFGRNQVASAERGLIARELGRDEAKRSLEVLLGRYPAAAIEGRAALPTLTRRVPAGLPSELLMRRPDLAAAAADLRAAADRASAAHKDHLPSIALTGGGSTSAASLDLLKLIRDPSSIALNVASSLTQPVYRGGALKARARQSVARQEAAIATFSSIALRAFREVESALAAERSMAAQEAFLTTERQVATLAESQALREYSQGLVDILSVLEAQRRAFNARNAMISLRNQRLQNRIDLYLALGGDFESPPTQTSGVVETVEIDAIAEHETAGLRTIAYPPGGEPFLPRADTY